MIFGKNSAYFINTTDITLSISAVAISETGKTKITFTTAHGYDSAEDKILKIVGVVGWAGLNGTHLVIERFSDTILIIDLVYSAGYSSGGTVQVGEILNYCIIKPSWEEPDQIVRPSIITGVRDVVEKGDYSSFIVEINLWKYASASDKLKQLYLWNHVNVYFYPYIDGSVDGDLLGKPIQDDNGDEEFIFHI